MASADVPGEVGARVDGDGMDVAADVHPQHGDDGADHPAAQRGTAVRRILRRSAAWYRRQPRWRRRTLLSVTALLTAAVTFVGAIGVALFVEGSGSPSPAARSTGHDALWLGHAWVGWPASDDRAGKTDADFAALVALVRSSGIKDLFVHDGPFDMDGTLDPARSPGAARFVAAVHRELPGVRVQAWLGQDVGRSQLRLNDPATRGRIVAGVAAALDLGFDGVHFDFEPVADGDEGFVSVLTASHAVISARHALLSVSVPQVEPVGGWRWPGDLLAGHPKWWSQGYLRRVAGQCDQVAVMAYDTALPTAWAYRGYVARQTQVTLHAVPPGVGLLIGVPAFHTHDPGHWDFAETMRAALAGVRLGLGAHPGGREFGVALYVDFAATSDDWAAYRTDWLSPIPAARRG
jgi:hypothetical protein